MSRIEPQPATMIAVVSQEPTFHEWSLRRGQKLPSASESMNRATRVPASTEVRMNRASNMIAKWYQKLIMASPPKILCMIVARPTARVGAPPVRLTIDVSPTSLAVVVRVLALACTPDKPKELT